MQIKWNKLTTFGELIPFKSLQIEFELLILMIYYIFRHPLRDNC